MIILAIVSGILTIGLLYSVKLRKGTTPDSRAEEQLSNLVVKLEDIGIGTADSEEETKQEKMDQNESRTSSLTQNELDDKLPDNISSRDHDERLKNL